MSFQQGRTGTQGLFSSLVLVLTFFLIIDFEFTVGGVVGRGERVGYAYTMIEGELVENSRQSLSVKMTDIVSLFLLCLMVVPVWLKGGARYVQKFDWRQYLYLALFILTGLGALVWNIGSYSQEQFIVCLLYLAKFGEISLVYLFTRAYFNGGGRLDSLMKATLLAGSIAALAGILNPFTGVFSGWLIMDRVQFYGTLTLLGAVWLSLALSGRIRSSGFSVPPQVLWGGAVLAGLAALTCGKRTVTIGLMFSYGFVLLAHLNMRTVGKALVITCLLAVVGGPFVAEQIATSFGHESGEWWQGLRQDYSVRISESWVSSVEVSGLDYSFMERVAKWLVATDYFPLNPVVGIGFWGTPYVYNFIPDSAFFQVLLETGLLGSGLLLMFQVRAWVLSRKAVPWYAGVHFGIGFRGAWIGLLVMGVTSNPIYIFNLFGVFLILVAVSHQLHQTSLKMSLQGERLPVEAVNASPPVNRVCKSDVDHAAHLNVGSRAIQG